LLSELRETKGPLSLRIALRILLDAMSGLSALHRARGAGKPLGFVHGEVTPESIVVGKDGVARLIPLVKAHWSPSPPAPIHATGYTAPEKLLDDPFDQRADVFSAGVLLWEAMMGRSLFGAASAEEIVTQLVGGKVARPSIAIDAPWSAELADVVMRALAVDPADRWDHVGIMGADIETIAEGQVARTSDVAVLITGRQLSRDSLSDEITMPLAAVPSLSPFANSIPATPDEPTSPDSPGALSARRLDSTEPVASATRKAAERAPLAQRRRLAIFGGALAFCALVLAIAGIKRIAQPSDSTMTVLAPAAGSPVPPPTTAEPIPFVTEPSDPIERPIAPASSAPSPAPSAGRAKAAAPAPKGKPKEDPFGLMKPVKAKQKDDPFGL
jgi:serine/threonine-protein kinase